MKRASGIGSVTSAFTTGMREGKAQVQGWDGALNVVKSDYECQWGSWS